MELSYWESRWKKNKTGFHMPEGYPGLRRAWPALDLPKEPDVLVPLCGKSIDMLFLRDQNASVTGVEVSEKAVRDFFDENNLEFGVRSYADFTIYTSGTINIWQGDFMKFPSTHTRFDLIYDKAALVALPPGMRKQYAWKIREIASEPTKILLHHFVYPQQEMTGPPFSVAIEEIDSYFNDRFSIDLLEESTIPSSNFLPFQRRGLSSSITERLLLLTSR